MLNSLASYLLGYPGSTAAAPSSAPGSAAEGGATVTAHVPPAAAALPVDVRLSAVEADDDWLLVDKTDDEASSEGASPSTSPAVTVPAAAAAARLTLAVSTTSYHWPDSDEAASLGAGAALGAPGACPLEESWFVTPPPCFTSGSVPLETSPLENLLIEHPSMSVYHRSAAPQAPATPLSSSVGASPSPPPRSPQGHAAVRPNVRKLNRPAAAAQVTGKQAAAAAADTSAPPRTASSSSSPSTSPDASVERRASAATSSPTRSSSPNPAQTTAVQASPRRPTAFSPYQQQQQSIQYRTAQKLVQRAACQQLKRDSLERNNKAREIRSSRNKRQRRSDHMQHGRHSGANNNRKC
ncbi:Tumor protein p53-inducible nuclear protein 1 [Frankliniella fusca]|uniref:Tumor protein p53-inducible nuclear protein 1 n=1 Tax=Frankliniella fusca TaxID=407009 RepID=A0AAE1H1G3_9NEOP|nr:Tumor protein p53-inducible nuclear protein 1 [Frankliniella fusca]